MSYIAVNIFEEQPLGFEQISLREFRDSIIASDYNMALNYMIMLYDARAKCRIGESDIDNIPNHLLEIKIEYGFINHHTKEIRIAI